VYNPNPYHTEILYRGDPRRSPNPLRAIIAHVNWEIVAAFIILIGFFVFVLWQNQANTQTLGTVGLVVVGWIFSLCLHEFAHAATAFIGGDHSDSTRSYLAFNPLKYIHPVLSILFPLLFIFLGGIPLPGGAVYLNRDLVRNRAWQSAISLAGPLMNALFAVLAAIPFFLGITDQHPYLAFALALFIFFQIFSVILNLLPIPPLDGFGIIAPWLEPQLRNTLYAFGNYGFLLIFLLVWYVQPISAALTGLVYSAMTVLHVAPNPDAANLLVSLGYYAFFFWQRH